MTRRRHVSRAAAVALAFAVGLGVLGPGVAAGADDEAPFGRWRAMRTVRALADGIGPRVRGTAGEAAAATHVADRLAALGYRVKVQTFAVDGRTSRNVVAWWPGVADGPFVLGAHLDTVPGSPGANDNASGVALLMEVAGLIAGTEHTRWVKLVFFGAEERGPDGRHHVGSQVFVSRQTPRGLRRMPGMLSVDMVADGSPLIVGITGLAPRVVAATFARVARHGGIDVEVRVTCDCSDNGPFERAGVPGGFVWSGFEPDHHEPTDTPENMSSRDLARSGQAVLRFVSKLDWALIKRFREV